MTLPRISGRHSYVVLWWPDFDFAMHRVARCRRLKIDPCCSGQSKTPRLHSREHASGQQAGVIEEEERAFLEELEPSEQT